MLGFAQAVAVHVQLDLCQVIGDVVGRLFQQWLEGLAGFVELAAFYIGNRQAITGYVIFRVFIQLLAKAFGRQPRGFFVIELHPGADQLIAQAVFSAAWPGLFRAVAGIGDTRLGDRVSQQKFRRPAIKTVLAHQALKHGGHGARVVTGFLQVKNADAVSFLLILAREASLLLQGRSLGAGNRSDAGISCARGCNDDPGEQRCHHRQLHALLGFHATGKVALGQVGQFVGHYRGIFTFGLGIEEQAAVNPDDAAGCGEGVELRAVDQDEFQAAVLHLAGFDQFVDTGLDVVLELRVVEL